MKPDPKTNSLPEDLPPSEKELETPACSCVLNPFADLPPALKPKKESWKTGFRQVTCLDCGLEFWTNSKGDLCAGCEKTNKKF